MKYLSTFEKYPAVQDYSELEQAINHIIPLNPKIILEIGVYQCGLLRILDDIFQPDLLMGIDDTDEPLKYSTNAVLFTPMKSQDIETFKLVVKELNGRKLDLLVIDGDHRFDSVKRDFEMYKNLMNENSCIFFHDIFVDDHNIICEVKEYWKAIKDDYKHIEIRHNFGIGLIFLND